MIKLKFGAVMAVLVSISLPPMALAQDQLGAAAMTETPCPAPTPSSTVGLIEDLLTPGVAVAIPAPDANDLQFQAFQKRQQEDRARDFAARCRFQPENGTLDRNTRIVFMGDSITEFWPLGDPSFFGNGIVNRGISGQTTPQMLLRFYQDVVALHPKTVHIMAGTNNLAGNTGPNSPEDFKNDIRAMVDLASANGIAVALASIPPADRFTWRPDLRPAAQILSLNDWLRDFAEERQLKFIDYYSAMVEPGGGMKAELSNDGVHPNRKGYAVMRQVAEAVLTR